MRNRGIAALLFAGGVLLAAITYAVLYLVVQRGPVYDFMCGRGYYQHISTALLFYGLLLVAYRRFEFASELRSLQMELPTFQISPEDAAKFAERIPKKYRDTIFGHRIAEALLGYARNEDVGPLMDRLAQNDRENLERSASLLSWVRSMPPVLGLLGTLDGLRGGTAEIATISGADNLDKMRSALQRFALSSSTAFDCTLMGIIAALILSVFIFFIRKREDAYLGVVDLKAHQLSRQFKRHSELEEGVLKIARDFMAEFFARLESTLARSR
jgi:biopolymer transport protein ExbB/TolQ